MPLSIVVGILIGYFILKDVLTNGILDKSLLASLILLYTGVGISMGSNRKVFLYVKKIGFKILFISLAIMVGSLAAGFLSSFILRIPLEVSILSASGMSYYSITGAYMTNLIGIEAGTYGFIVNVMREFFTVLLLPLLIKISKGTPIASGAAGGMDTMLMPITKFVGVELGLVTLITGTILTFVATIWLPIIGSFF